MLCPGLWENPGREGRRAQGGASSSCPLWNSCHPFMETVGFLWQLFVGPMASGASRGVLPRVPSPTLPGPSDHDLVTCPQGLIVPSCLWPSQMAAHLPLPSSTWVCLAPCVLLFPLPRTPCPLGPRHSWPTLLQEAVEETTPPPLPQHSLPHLLGSHSSCLHLPSLTTLGCHCHWFSGCLWTGSRGRGGEGFWSALNRQCQPGLPEQASCWPPSPWHSLLQTLQPHML